MKLKTISENIITESIESEYERFINEANESDKYNPTIDKIKKAIKNRKYVGIYYEGEGNVEPGFRLLECYVLGQGYVLPSGKVTHENDYYLRAFVIMESKKDKNKHIRKLHRTSVSKSMRVPAWRLFCFQKIKSLETLRFTITEARADYNPKDSMIDKIIQSAAL